MLEALVIVLLPWPMKFGLDVLLSSNRLATGLSHQSFLDSAVSGYFAQIPSLPLAFKSRLSPYLGQIAPLLAALIGLTIALGLIAAFLRNLSENLKMQVSRQTTESMRTDILRTIITSDQSFLDRHQKMDLIDRLTIDLNSTRRLIEESFSAVFRSGAVFILAFALMLSVNLTIALVYASCLPSLYFLNSYFAKRARKAKKRSERESDQIDQELQTMLAQLAQVKSLAVEEQSLAALFDRSRRYFTQVFNAKRSEISAQILQDTSKNFVRCLVLLIGGRAVFSGDLTIGSLALAFLYIDIIERPIKQIADFSSRVRTWVQGARKIDNLYLSLSQHRETEGTQAVSSLPFPDATAVHFENIAFAFERGPVLFRSLNADVRPGEMIAIIGASGSGKSTFTRLLNRLLDPVEGRILLGRTDLRRFRLSRLRRTVTLVERSGFFMRGSVRENLLLGIAGDPGTSKIPSDSQISEALHRADCDFVSSLPSKIETVIGEGGYQLKETELQQLNLARAFLREESRIFVFDDAVEGLNEDSREQIVEAIMQMTETGSVVFLVTDYPSDVLKADRVLFFDRSSAVPLIATHKDLLAQSTRYRLFFEQLRLQKLQLQVPVANAPNDFFPRSDTLDN